jgi:hypothetical protein
MLWASCKSLERDAARCRLSLLGFMSRWGSTASAREAAQAGVLARGNMPTMILCETRGLQLYWVMRGGIG